MYLKLAKKYYIVNKVLYTQCVRAHETVDMFELQPKIVGVWGGNKPI